MTKIQQSQKDKAKRIAHAAWQIQCGQIPEMADLQALVSQHFAATTIAQGIALDFLQTHDIDCKEICERLKMHDNAALEQFVEWLGVTAAFSYSETYWELLLNEAKKTEGAS